VKDQLATQDYVKTIASLLIKEESGMVKLKAISAKMDISNAAVSDMLKKLEKDGLVINHAYKGIELTPSGWQLGRRLIRHHRLWEVFLHHTLDVPWDEIHDEAEHLEHAASESLMERIDAYLGHPKVDPHGNPIPSVTGELLFNSAECPLVEAKLNVTYYVTRFEGLDSTYLTYLSSNEFAIGVRIQVLQQFEFDQSILCHINGHQLQLSHAIANQIFVSSLIE
tara:strand:- start:1315 stop:1986 length:672 start_codon:yes stop_codon:yes gene_type:complete